jgi:hypothetical protein
MATLVCDLSAGELPCVLAFLRDIVTGSASCLYDPSATAIPCAFVGGDVEIGAESCRRHGGCRQFGVGIYAGMWISFRGYLVGRVGSLPALVL